jgi:hypothetical protein
VECCILACENGRQGSNTAGMIQRQRQHSTGQDKRQRQQYWYERLGLAPEIDQHVVTQTSKTALGRELSPRERESRLNLSNKSHSHPRRA